MPLRQTTCDHDAVNPAPASFRDSQTGGPAFGAYAGPLPRVGLGQIGMRDRIARRKRWVYMALNTDALWTSFAIVRTGYAATAFAFVYDLAEKRMLVDRTVLGLAAGTRVADDPHAPGELARFAFGKTELTFTRAGPELEARVRMGDLELEATLDESVGPRAITAVAELGPGLWNATEKRALLATRGRGKIAGRELSFKGARGGYDYTHGLLPRHTEWRWAFAQGKTKAGEPIGFNLVSGFVGSAECAVFTNDEIAPLAEPMFAFDKDAPDKPWRLKSADLDLRFDVGAVHSQHTNLVLVKSHFIQPVGTFTGTVRIDGRTVEVEGLPGVVEDQDVLW